MSATLFLLMLIPAADLGREVEIVFAARCLTCHGDRPKANLDLRDLPKLVARQDLLVPGKPEQSDLWKLVVSGNMPPNDSPTGPLSDAEKQVITEWIRLGTPLPVEIPEPLGPPAPAEGNPAASAATPPVALAAPARTPPAWTWRTLKWLGKFHLLLLHFPIVLVISSVLSESWRWWSQDERWSTLTRMLLWGAGLSAVPVVVLGWLHGMSYGRGSLLAWHRWMGTVVGVLLNVTAVLAEMDSRAKKHSWLCRLVLYGTALLTGLTAHFGGEMVHGSNFLDW